MRRQFRVGGFDQASMAEAWSGPGMDPRQWLSYGLVDAGDSSEDVLTFDEEYGPLINVTLQPSGIPVRCRVGALAAGNGEGDYYPFISNEEVLVAIPEGDERAECVIISRLNNGLDGFPQTSVGGQDPSTNTFGFVRRKAPMIYEYGYSVLFRNAMTESFFSMDQDGAVTIRDGSANAFQMTADVAGFLDSTGTCSFQFDLDDKRFTVLAGGSTLTLVDGNSTSTIASSGPFAVSANGAQAAEHVTTVEAVAAILSALLPLLPFPVPITPPAQYAIVAGAITAATAGINSAVLAAINTALTTPKPPAVPPGQSFPGVGCAGFLAG